MSYYVFNVIMTLRDVVGWSVRGFWKKGVVRLGLFLLGPLAWDTQFWGYPFSLDTGIGIVLNLLLVLS